MVFCTGLAAQDTLRMTLDSCLRYAFGHNYQVVIAELGRESAEATLSGAKMQFLPSLSASASQSLGWEDNTTRNGNYGISGSLTLFNGLSNLNNLRQSRVGAEQSSLKVRQTESSIGEQIVSAYLTILMNEEKMAYQQEVVNTSRQQREEGELKYRVGRILESDYMLLDANLTSTQAEIENTRLTIEDNRYVLALLLGYEGHGVIEVVHATDSLRSAGCVISPLDTVMAQARRTMPDWQISEMDVRMAEYNVAMARSAFMPTVSLGGGVSYNEGSIISDNPVTSIKGGLNTSLTLGVSIPLLNRGTSLTQYRQSKIALRQAETQHSQTLLELEEKIENMHLEQRQALNRFHSAEALAEAYKASYDVYVVKYGEGAVTTVEMLQQQDRYLSALNDYLQSKYSYLMAEKQLDIYTGKEITL